MDLLATDQLARAFYDDVCATAGNQADLARYQFLDPASRRFCPDWDLAADIAVAVLRTGAGRNPHDKGLDGLAGELSTRRDDFRTRWGPTTSATTAPAPSTSTTGPSATSPSPTRHWKWPPNPASPSSSAPDGGNPPPRAHTERPDQGDPDAILRANHRARVPKHDRCRQEERPPACSFDHMKHSGCHEVGALPVSGGTWSRVVVAGSDALLVAGPGGRRRVA